MISLQTGTKYKEAGFSTAETLFIWTPCHLLHNVHTAVRQKGDHEYLRDVRNSMGVRQGDKRTGRREAGLGSNGEGKQGRIQEVLIGGPENMK